MGLLMVTLTAGWQKIFAADPRLGFLSHARDIAARIAAGTQDAAVGARLIFNDRMNAVLAAFFMATVVALVIASALEWLAVTRGRKPATTREALYVESAYAK
jgi:carbon starvation protein